MKHGGTPKKSLGQHWLRDEGILEAIVSAAGVDSGDSVLEVGPGLGTLTAVLVKKAKHVYAVEYDSQLAQELAHRVPSDNLSVEEADILDYDFRTLPDGYKVVANIPYYLTSHLIRKLLETEKQPAKIALLIQKEVAERIVAQPGKMSLLSVSAQFYADCELSIEVGAEYFDPPPKVDSQVVVLAPKANPDLDTKKFFRLVKAGFGEKRKKLTNSLAGGLHMEKSEVATLLEQEGIHANARAQELSVEQWVSLYERMNQIDAS